MTISAEVWLMVTLAGLYLYDSVLLLYCNEAVLTPVGRKRWAVRFGSSQMGLSGRELLIPDPLRFHQPLFRLSWSFERKGAKLDAEPERAVYRPFAPMLWAIASGLFILLPLGFFSPLGNRALLPALILIFGNIAMAMIWLWLHRRTFHIDGRRFAALAFESLICPPFALNLVRHLSLAQPLAADAVEASRKLVVGEEWTRAQRQFTLRLESEIESEDPLSERHQALLARRESLPGKSIPCQD